MKNWISALVLAILGVATQAQTTCVDPLACNFTELGECEFLDDNGMPCVTEGCAIPGACNFDPEADINDGSCEFTSCLGCTDEAACNYDSEAVYLDLSCIYFVDCNGVCGGDWIEDECGNCYEQSTGEAQEVLAINSPGVYDFEVGPGDYTFECRGAKGGHNVYCGANGGRGAAVEFNYSFSEASVLEIVVGGAGGTDGYNGANLAGGGGGGTFIVLNGELLVAAGGGGSGAICDGGGSWDLSPGMDASLSECGTSDRSGNTSIACNGESGQNGGGGWNELQGNFNLSSGLGGFGGGGEPGNSHSGGGGGGYSGGSVQLYSGGNASGGGGGSCFAPENAELSHHEDSNGSITISFLQPLVPNCELGCVIAQACNFNPEATNDDGSCDFCFCGPGTEYDLELGQCMIVNGSSDINGDGCTNLGDLLDLLSGYGTCED